MNDAKSHIQSSFECVDVNINQRHGKLLPAIEHFNSKNRVIVIGRRGEDHKDNRINIGSEIEMVVRASSVPVLICSETFKTSTSYMLAFDDSKTAINV